MRSGFRLLPLFLRRGARGHDLTALALTAAGVAVATTVALMVLSLRPGLDARDDRAAWREPSAASSEGGAVATQVRSTDIFAGDLIDRVDLAPAAERSAATGLPTPPGLPTFPRAGEVFVSPALARLLENQPADRLADRFPRDVVGEIGPEGLAHGDELVAVVGHEAGDMVPGGGGERYPEGERTPDSPSPVTAIDGFARSGTDPDLDVYRGTAIIGAVVLTMPALLLIGSAARLTAARRNQRLAALRLAGATPGTVVTLTVAETAAAAAAGAVAGVMAYMAILPVMAQIPFAGGPWAASDLWLGWAPVLMAMVGAPLLAALCAAVALRQVVISPLGVAQRVRTRRPRSIRLLGMALAWLLLIVVAQSAGSSDVVPIAVAVAAVIGSLALVGPWITWAIGAVFAHLARRPSTMLAARRILDDPKAAYRAVSGIVLAGLLAGFLFTLTPTMNRLDDGLVDGNTLEAWFDTEQARPELVASMEDHLDRAGLDARVDREDFEYGTTVISVTPTSGTDREEVRTALHGLVPQQPLVASSDDVFGDETLLDDFRRASLMIAIAAVVLAATTTAIASSASILDQRTTLCRLRLAGTPVSTLQRARAWQTMLPMVAATTGSVLSGMAAGLVLLGTSGGQVGSPDLAGIGAVVGFGVALALLAGIVTRPLLEATTRVEAAA